MAGRTTLRSLIQGIAGAIASAQQEIERQQIFNVASFFDKDLRPKQMRMRLPSLRHDAAPGDEDFVEVPALTLAPLNPLRISEVEVQFDIELGGMEDDGTLDPPSSVQSMQDNSNTAPAPKVRRILTDAFNGASAAKGPRAHVVVKVRDAEVPEGLARILTELNKMQGTRPAPADPPPVGPAAPVAAAQIAPATPNPS